MYTGLGSRATSAIVLSRLVSASFAETRKGEREGRRGEERGRGEREKERERECYVKVREDGGRKR